MVGRQSRKKTVKPFHGTIKRSDEAIQLLSKIAGAWMKLVGPRGDSAAAIRIWDVLTGLRGPDEGVHINDVPDHIYKRATTGLIRQRFLVIGRVADPNIFLVPHSFNTTSEDSDEYVKIRKKISLDSHFGGHARSAFAVLGLTWSKKNDVSLLNPEPSNPGTGGRDSTKESK